jgi:hypothetical protein
MRKLDEEATTPFEIVMAEELADETPAPIMWSPRMKTANPLSR